MCDVFPSLSKLNSFDTIQVCAKSDCTSAKRTRASKLKMALSFAEHQFKNTYVVCRHGQSTANVDEIISSDPSVSCVTHGLTALGRQQCSAATQHLIQLMQSLHVTHLECYTSDFLRTVETTQCICDAVQSSVAVTHRVSQLLRERDFGEFNGRSTSFYQTVWDNDSRIANSESSASQMQQTETQSDPQHQPDDHRSHSTQATETSNDFLHSHHVESCCSVARRCHDLITQCESLHSNQLILFVTHGDTAQIMQTLFTRHQPEQHRLLEHLDHCQLRQLNHAKRTT